MAAQVSSVVFLSEKEELRRRESPDSARGPRPPSSGPSRGEGGGNVAQEEIGGIHGGVCQLVSTSLLRSGG